MKQLFFVLVVVATLTSCTSDEIFVQAKNGAIMRVHNGYNLPVLKGQKLCIKQSGLIPNWYVPNDGVMKDTAYMIYNHDKTQSLYVEYMIVKAVGIAR